MRFVIQILFAFKKLALIFAPSIKHLNQTNMIYQSNYNGKCFWGDHKGATNQVMYPDFDLYEQVDRNDIYTIFKLKDQFKASESTKKPQQILHR